MKMGNYLAIAVFVIITGICLALCVAMISAGMLPFGIVFLIIAGSCVWIIADDIRYDRESPDQRALEIARMRAKMKKAENDHRLKQLKAAYKKGELDEAKYEALRAKYTASEKVQP